MERKAPEADGRIGSKDTRNGTEGSGREEPKMPEPLKGRMGKKPGNDRRKSLRVPHEKKQVPRNEEEEAKPDILGTNVRRIFTKAKNMTS